MDLPHGVKAYEHWREETVDAVSRRSESRDPDKVSLPQSHFSAGFFFCYRSFCFAVSSSSLTLPLSADVDIRRWAWSGRQAERREKFYPYPCILPSCRQRLDTDAWESRGDGTGPCVAPLMVLRILPRTLTLTCPRYGSQPWRRQEPCMIVQRASSTSYHTLRGEGQTLVKFYAHEAYRAYT